MDGAAHPVVHEEQPLHQAGRPLADANVAVILLHGRGSTAQQILTLADWFKRPDVAYLAPQAFGNTWYPFSFLVPLEHNEPYLTSALRLVGNLVRTDRRSGDSGRTNYLGRFFARGMLGFGVCRSQCAAVWRLVCIERRRHRSGGYPTGLPGGIGRYTGVYWLQRCRSAHSARSCSRIHEVFRELGGDVTEKIYPGMATYDQRR